MAGIPKYHGKRDLNENEIILALRAAGCSIAILSQTGVPDLLVSYTDENRLARTILIEVKSKGGTLTPAEKEFMESWQGEVYVCYSIEDALEAVGR